MSGIYIHIPFCLKKCKYCDFYKSTEVAEIDNFISMLKKELWFRRDYLSDEYVQTVYFGGGTPSLLSAFQILQILTAVKSVFKINRNAEITIEMNPDDINPAYIESLKTTGINRVSLGVQSFNDDTLNFLGRRHNSGQAADAIKNLQKAGFDNISIDLIYGIPGMTVDQWKKNLDIAFHSGIKHISAYHLTYHEGTALFEDLKKGRISEVEEEVSVNQFNELIEQAASNNFIHYEISNFALDSYFSKHNSSYWKQQEYLGLGPSAHSFNGNSRQWNISSLKKYLKSNFLKDSYFEKEKLSDNDKFNDYILTSLRTIWGIDLNFISDNYGEEYLNHVIKILGKYIDSEYIEKVDNIIKLTKKGFFISDKVISDFIH
ncbi:MAG: radical SAM family heme chaperone HemW [Prolixibacteraceae bacterium]|nr:radical SAM family heme chaperone HemW [Prolixibacteraceae bacterium]